MPPASLTARSNGGVCVKKFATPGSFDASRDATCRSARTRRPHAAVAVPRSGARGTRPLESAMSTMTGQSFVQPLHARQRSSALDAPRPNSSRRARRHSASRRAVRARPRVVCFSSRVTMKLGHMMPPSVRGNCRRRRSAVVACANDCRGRPGSVKCVFDLRRVVVRSRGGGSRSMRIRVDDLARVHASSRDPRSP